jgi:hypothetical protein
MTFRRPTGPSQRGQASVELVAALPVVLLLAAVAWQCALAGHAAVIAAHAARAGARADLVGSPAASAARSAIPERMENGLTVERENGAVRVRVRVPALLPGRQMPFSIGASASLRGRR